MKWIVITSPQMIRGEVSFIQELIEMGVDRVHLRKPDYSLVQFESLLSAIPQDYLCHIVLNDYFELCNKYNVAGLHLNGRNPVFPAGFCGQRSCSCHSLGELAQNKDRFDYLFLSPIFDSISKEGYKSAFSLSDLENAAAAGVIDCKTVALGGVSGNNIPVLKQLGFGGAALLGDVWNRFLTSPQSAREYLVKMRELML